MEDKYIEVNYTGMKNNSDSKQNQIKTLAWEIFQRKLGLRFKCNFTAEEKKKITDIPDYQQYRNEAIKIYNKRLAKKEISTHNKKYPIIKVNASGKPNWYGGARTWCFVYSKKHGNFILEGYLSEVETYLKKNYTHYFCYWSMWCHYESRGIWEFWKDSIGVFEPSKMRKTWKYTVKPYYSSGLPDEEIQEKTFTFKRLPKRWIPEFDKL